MKVRKILPTWRSNSCLYLRENHVIVSITEISLISTDKSGDGALGRSSIVIHGKETAAKTSQQSEEKKEELRYVDVTKWKEISNITPTQVKIP